MRDFNATLVREKISLTEPATDAGAPVESTVIRNNRMVLALGDRLSDETVVVRGQHMHTTLRLASKIIYSHDKNGSFRHRAEPYDWPALWDLLLTAHDRKHHPDSWAAVYINGKPVFETAAKPLLNVIEKCAHERGGDYEAAVQDAAALLRAHGKPGGIEATEKVAAALSDNGQILRCGIINRADGRSSMFNFTATGGEGMTRLVQGAAAAAAFLEAIDIRHQMRVIQRGLREGRLMRASPEMGRYNALMPRLNDLYKFLSAFESHFDVKYRPERPDVFNIIKSI